MATPAARPFGATGWPDRGEEVEGVEESFGVSLGFGRGAAAMLAVPGPGLHLTLRSAVVTVRVDPRYRTLEPRRAEPGLRGDPRPYPAAPKTRGAKDPVRL